MVQIKNFKLELIKRVFLSSYLHDKLHIMMKILIC